MAHRGLREWTGEEAGNLFLGQNGFHILSNGAFAIGATETITNADGSTSHTGKSAGSYWVAIKAIGAAVVSARSYSQGDDLSQTGAYNGAQLTLADGDIVYGAFDAITVDSGDFVVAYIGR